MTKTPIAAIARYKAHRGTQPGRGRAQKQTLYHYESAGITEREGMVPAWLWAVAAALLTWGFYYLVAYWSAPVIPA
jgi:hypothetical protein